MISRNIFVSICVFQVWKNAHKMWKNEKKSLTKNIFCQINSFVTYFSKTIKYFHEIFDENAWERISRFSTLCTVCLWDPNFFYVKSCAAVTTLQLCFFFLCKINLVKNFVEIICCNCDRQLCYICNCFLHDINFTWNQWWFRG